MLTIPSSAQIAPSAPVSAVELARRVDGHYNRLHSLKASFDEQYDGLGMHRGDSGTLELEKPGKMRWDYKSKAGKVFVLDGKYAWFYAPGEPSVKRIAASKLDDLRSPLRFLLGHTKVENELIGLTATAASAARSYVLAGVPKGMEKRIQRLTLTVTESGAIEGITIVELDGARTSFTFTGEDANPRIAETEFRFVPPAGVVVVNE